MILVISSSPEFHSLFRWGRGLILVANDLIISGDIICWSTDDIQATCGAGSLTSSSQVAKGEMSEEEKETARREAQAQAANPDEEIVEDGAHLP